ncbi:MAG: hypothetical protein GXP26_11460 [Planctomycetes bacterium]|nr:hypothetical protein [Planctomycetota bacterium]
MGAVFLTYATGYGGQEEVETIIKVITTALVVLVLLYTVLGGMVAVIVTDYVQFAVLSLGMLLGLAFCVWQPELGWENLVATWGTARGEGAFSPISSPRYGWSYLLCQAIFAAAATICWAPNATRSLTTTSEKTTRRAYAFSSFGLFARFAIPGLWGILAFAFVHMADGPLGLSEYFSGANLQEFPERSVQAMPLLLGKVLPTIWLGLLTAGLMAAFMSTHDSYLLAWASVATNDIFAPLIGRKLSSRESILSTRLSVLVIGALLIVVGIWYELPENVWPFLFITGTIYLSGASTALLGGMYWRRASSTGAMLALGGGLLAILALFEGWFQEHVAQMLGHVADDGTILTDEVGRYANGNTITVACFAMCALLFVAGSLLFPDKISDDHEKIGSP